MKLEKTLETMVNEMIEKRLAELNIQFGCETNEQDYDGQTLYLNLGDYRLSEVEIHIPG